MRYAFLRNLNNPIRRCDAEWYRTIERVCDKSHLPSYVGESVLQFYLDNRELLFRARRLEGVTALTHLYSKKFGLDRSLKTLCEQVYADRRLVGRYLFRFGTEIGWNGEEKTVVMQSAR